jgi:hypothetical protein
VIFDLDRIQPTLAGAGIELPRMAKARQNFSNTCLADIESSIQKGVAQMDAPLQGKRIAITVGSRGIWDIARITAVLIEALRGKGAVPFIVPAMGSHGGATSAGQRHVLAEYGITEDSMRVAILDSMETVELGCTSQGLPVYCQKDAFQADGIIVMNKIKPHADFKSDIESGLTKMMVIGLGKHEGATQFHRRGFDQIARFLEPAGELFLQKAPVILGIGIIENAYDRLMELCFVQKEDLIREEKAMLRRAKANIARLHLSAIDVLVIQRIGKDISGEGMDPNVTGRPGSYLNEGFDAPTIQRIVVLGMTEATNGNGVGIGMADFTTVDLIRQLDLSQAYTNAVTSTLIGPAKLPVVARDEKTALDLALRTCNRLDPVSGPKIVMIRDTAHLDEIYVSRALTGEIDKRDDISIVSDFEEIRFNTDGQILF